VRSHNTFAPGGWYHCYNRGVEKRRVFETNRDYERFLQTLYLCNNSERVHQDDLREWSHAEILQYPREDTLVNIGAYCLMSNHFHLLLQSKQEGAVSKFMHRVGISYTMYFNIKNERTGNLFMRPFRSKHISEDRYFKRVAQYIHLNPAELFEPGWKQGRIKNASTLDKKLQGYGFSSYPDYFGIHRPERVILANEAVSLLSENTLSISKLITEAAAYYQELT